MSPTSNQPGPGDDPAGVQTDARLGDGPVGSIDHGSTPGSLGAAPAFTCHVCGQRFARDKVRLRGMWDSRLVYVCADDDPEAP